MRVLFINPDSNTYLATLPSLIRAAGVTIDSLKEEQERAKSDSSSVLDTWCRSRDVRRTNTGERLDAVFASWSEEVGNLEMIVALAGRLSDLTIVDRPSGTMLFAERVFDTAVFATGRPVLVVPQLIPDDLLRHVAIAWNGSLEAARVIGQSIDLLHEADRVSIIEVTDRASPQTQAAALGDYLRWHGIITHRSHVDRTTYMTFGEALLARVAQDEATLLVLGANTHSRVRGFLLGGVTRHVLEHTTIPLLMAH